MLWVTACAACTACCLEADKASMPREPKEDSASVPTSQGIFTPTADRVGHSEPSGKNWELFLLFASKKHGVFFGHFLVFVLKKASWKTLADLTTNLPAKKRKTRRITRKGAFGRWWNPGPSFGTTTIVLHLQQHWQRHCWYQPSQKNLPKIWKSSELSKGSLLGPKANHSERMRKAWKPMETFEEFCLKLETNHMLGSCRKTLENQWSSWQSIGWVPFIKYTYMDYIYIYIYIHIYPLSSRVWANPQTNQSSMFQQLYKSHLSHQNNRAGYELHESYSLFSDGILGSWFMKWSPHKWVGLVIPYIHINPHMYILWP